MTVVIYLVRGETLVFKDVEHINVTPNEVTFEYTGLTLGGTRKALFWRDQIAGMTYNE